MMRPRVAVLGAGTMGSGIAGLSCRAGSPTVLYDVDEESLSRGVARIKSALQRDAEKGRLSGEEAAAAAGRLIAATDSARLEGSDLVIEAIPERLQPKREILKAAAAVAPEAVLASNTSSLPISSIGEGLPRPDRLVGLHFFNPPAAMPLVELVVTPGADPDAVAMAREIAEAMDKTVIEVSDSPGFLINRCARPYYLEALRLLEDGVATSSQIDRICRAAGFPMGPFELMDLIGIDVGLEVTKAMWERSYAEPRWRPSATQTQMVAAGRLGRKQGGGFRVPGDELTEEPASASAPQVVALIGRDPVARELEGRLRQADLELVDADEPRCQLVIAFDPGVGVQQGGRVPVAISCGRGTNGRRRSPRACGFQLIAPLPETPLVELTSGLSTDPHSAETTAALFESLGFQIIRVGDAAGLVLGRIVAQLVNEASFAVAAGVAAKADVDRAMTRGLGHPRGPFEWAEANGPANLVDLLDALRREDGDPRYRVAPDLRRAALA